MVVGGDRTHSLPCGTQHRHTGKSPHCLCMFCIIVVCYEWACLYLPRVFKNGAQQIQQLLLINVFSCLQITWCCCALKSWWDLLKKKRTIICINRTTPLTFPLPVLFTDGSVGGNSVIKTERDFIAGMQWLWSTESKRMSRAKNSLTFYSTFEVIN